MYPFRLILWNFSIRINLIIHRQAYILTIVIFTVKYLDIHVSIVQDSGIMLTSDEIKDITGENGLATSRVAEHRTKYGANAMTPPVRESLWKQYL